ncbi:MAG TPA: hypothetical protein VIK15_07725 [Candidatus Anoxymicrobiaceae bacterium]
MGMEHDSPRPLLESTGWLAAHKRNQRWLKQSPVHFHRSSLTGEVSRERPSKETLAWHSWSLRLFSRQPLPGNE